MSIWSTWVAAGHDDSGLHAPIGDVRSYATGWSNHYPDTVVEQPSCVMVGVIPQWCVPGHQDDAMCDAVGEWLLLTAVGWRHDFASPAAPPAERESVSVSMNADAVRALRDQLTAWLDGPRVSAM